MKHRLLCLLSLLLCLSACSSGDGQITRNITQDTTSYITWQVTSELTQRYEPTDLRWQEGLFRALADPAEAYSVTAGLQANTGRLIVVYADDRGEQFWLECQTLNATQRAMSEDRQIPLSVWLTNEETPEARAELLLQGDDGARYAVFLCSNVLDEAALLQCARQVQVWLPGAAEAVTVACTDDAPTPPSDTPLWAQSGDLAPDAVDSLLQLRVDTCCSDLTGTGPWRLQRLENGRWYDMDQTGDGLSCDGSSVWGTVELPLPAGQYRLMLAATSQTGAFTELPYLFQSAG